MELIDNLSNLGLEEQILEFIKRNPEGVNKEMILTSIDADDREIVSKLNSLIEQNRINLMELQGEYIFKYRSEREAARFRDLTHEELIIYEAIIQSGSNGINTNEIKAKTNIQSTALMNKIFKKLEKKLLVKSLKILNTKNKKIWIGYEFEPSQEITGGVWCSNQELDKDLVSVIKGKVFSYLKDKVVTRNEIMLFIKSTNLVKHEVREEDIQKIINMLVFDDKVELIFPSGCDNGKLSILLKKGDPLLNLLKYRTTPEYDAKAILNCVPCTYCPVFKECQIDNIINPKDCPHMVDFMKLF
jgi:DNA-directed RNA polymerase III subunit RPC6